MLTGFGNYITVDFVVNAFDYEEPYTEKEDTKMDLQYLDGLDDSFNDELGKAKTGQPKRKGKFFNFINRVNPATVALRNGVLAAMKLNIGNIAEKVKWAYLPEGAAKKKGLDMGKWRHLLKVKDKMEQLFFAAGGKADNLKKAILTGKGNKHHEVSGLGYVPDNEVMGMDASTPIEELLGDIFYSENEGTTVQGDEEVGVVAAAASVAAASGFLATIGGLLKKIGDIFPKKNPGEKPTADPSMTTEEQNAGSGKKKHKLLDKLFKKKKGQPAADNSKKSDDNDAPATTTSAKADAGAESDAAANDTAADNTTDSTNTDDDNSASGNLPSTTNNKNLEPNFWDKNKGWIKPTLWTAGALLVIWGGYKIFHAASAKPVRDQPAKEQPKQALSGLKSRKKKPQKKKSPGKKQVALIKL